MCEKEKLFLELIEGFTWKYDGNEFYNLLLGFKNKKCLFEIYNPLINQQKIVVNYRLSVPQHLKNYDFYINKDEIIKPFFVHFGIYNAEIIDFITDMIKKHFKIYDVYVRGSVDIFTNEIEHHFNNK